jgi:hypothetical protein
MEIIHNFLTTIDIACYIPLPPYQCTTMTFITAYHHYARVFMLWLFLATGIYVMASANEHETV